MGGYYGSPSGILKNNRNLLKKNDRNKWKELPTTKNTAKKKYTEATPELLHQIRKKHTKKRIFNILIPIILTIAFFGLLCILYFYLM